MPIPRPPARPAHRPARVRTGRARPALAALALSLALAGCGEETLYSDLTEREVNALVAVLHSAGLPASKVTGADGSYSVSTPEKHFAAAVEVLQANGLPEERFDSLGNVFQKEGFVSSPLEERARLNHALSQEIAQTISSIDGVLLARVHLAVPQRDPLSDVQPTASASVFVKHRADVDLTGAVPQIKALVVDGIENLDYDHVTVELFEAHAPTRGTLPPVPSTTPAYAPADELPSEASPGGASSDGAGAGSASGQPAASAASSLVGAAAPEPAVAPAPAGVPNGLSLGAVLPAVAALDLGADGAAVSLAAAGGTIGLVTGALALRRRRRRGPARASGAPGAAAGPDDG